MTSYYPSQVSYSGHGHHHSHSHSHGQPVVYSTSGYAPAGYGGVPASGVVYVPPSSRSYSTGDHHHRNYDDDRHHRRHRPRRRHGHRHERYSHNPSYTYSGMPVAGMGAPVIMQPSQVGYGGYQQGYGGHPHWTFSQRVRRFFGLAPTPAFKYKSDRNTWGFMGYSKRQRYVDPRTGGEVDRHGHPVVRV